jgi:predicted O-methyltransferase YrrM
LELGTGIGLSLAWMIDGLSNDSSLISIDNNPELISIANEFFGEIENVDVICFRRKRMDKELFWR